MGCHECEDSPGIIQWTGDCEVMRFLPDGNTRSLLVLCLMSTDIWDSEFAGLMHVVNAWNSCVPRLIVTDGVGF